MLERFLNLRNILGLIAIAFIFGSIFFSNFLAKKIAADEKRKVQQYVEAVNDLNNINNQDTKLATKIIVENDKAIGVVTDKETIKADFVISNSDIKHVYTKLLDKKYYKEKILEQEKSLSALIFYWGIKKEFSNLSLHNMLFASQNFHVDWLSENDCSNR